MNARDRKLWSARRNPTPEKAAARVADLNKMEEGAAVVSLEGHDSAIYVKYKAAWRLLDANGQMKRNRTEPVAIAQYRNMRILRRKARKEMTTETLAALYEKNLGARLRQRDELVPKAMVYPDGEYQLHTIAPTKAVAKLSAGRLREAATGWKVRVKKMGPGAVAVYKARKNAPKGPATHIDVYSVDQARTRRGRRRGERAAEHLAKPGAPHARKLKQGSRKSGKRVGPGAEAEAFRAARRAARKPASARAEATWRSGKSAKSAKASGPSEFAQWFRPSERGGGQTLVPRRAAKKSAKKKSAKRPSSYKPVTRAADGPWEAFDTGRREDLGEGLRKRRDHRDHQVPRQERLLRAVAPSPAWADGRRSDHEEGHPRRSQEGR